MNNDELKFLSENFKTKFFNIYENSIIYLKKWKGFHNQILIEFNFNNKIPKNLDMNKVEEFCVDLSHFEASKERWTKEFDFILKKNKEWFIANHLNGY